MKKKEKIIIISISILLIFLCLLIPSKEEKQEENLIAEITTSTTTQKQTIWDNLTLEELTDKLNKNLYSTLSNTGIYFAEYTKNTGLDPYLAVSIVNHETGCKWGCSKLAKECNNIGGIKGTPSCGNTSYKKYDTLEEGIKSYLDLIYYNYYSQGLDTPEKMNSKYAESTTWAEKVNKYYQEIEES